MACSGGGGGEVEAGFAKLQGEDFEYYMQAYSIILGRRSKKSAVDVDLASLDGGTNISRHHARIFYDFPRRRFALEVIGKNGCLVEGVHHIPGHHAVKLDSQDLLQMGDTKFYFLLPSRSIFTPATIPRRLPLPAGHSCSGKQLVYDYDAAVEDEDDERTDEDEGNGSDDDDEEEEEEEEEEREEFGHSGGLAKKRPRVDAKGIMDGSSQPEKWSERSKSDRKADNYQLLLLEEKDVVSSVATVLSDLCGPGEWMLMSKLHAVLAEQYGNVWHHSRVRKYLTSEDCPSAETRGRPWFGLLMLLRKFPEHFVINTRSKCGVTVELVSLVSLIS